MKRANVPPSREFVQMGDFVGQVVALRFRRRQMVVTDYGETNVAEVDLVTTDGQRHEGLWCFWRTVAQQVGEIKPDHRRAVEVIAKIIIQAQELLRKFRRTAM